MRPTADRPGARAAASAARRVADGRGAGAFREEIATCAARWYVVARRRRGCRRRRCSRSARSRRLPAHALDADDVQLHRPARADSGRRRPSDRPARRRDRRVSGIGAPRSPTSTSASTGPRAARTKRIDDGRDRPLVAWATSSCSSRLRAGATVAVVSHAGGTGNSGNNFCQVLLDDDVGGRRRSRPPRSRTPPFTGHLVARRRALSAFDGEDPNGSWTLAATDSALIDTGSVARVLADRHPEGRADDRRHELGRRHARRPVSADRGRERARARRVADSVDFNLLRRPTTRPAPSTPAFTQPRRRARRRGQRELRLVRPDVGRHATRWVAAYSGDANNVARDARAAAAPGRPCRRGSRRDVTTIAGTSSANTAQGGVVADTALVSGRAPRERRATRVDVPPLRPRRRDVRAAPPRSRRRRSAVDAGGAARSPDVRVTAPGRVPLDRVLQRRREQRRERDAVRPRRPRRGRARAGRVREPAHGHRAGSSAARRCCATCAARGSSSATLTAVGGAVVKQTFTKTVATIDLRGLPKGRYTIRVKIRQRSGKTFTFTRTYQTCEFPRSVSVTP